MSNHLAKHGYWHVSTLVIAMTLACSARSESGSLRQRFDAFSRVERTTRYFPERLRFAVIGATYDQMVAPIRQRKNLEGVADDDLKILYHAAQLATFYTHDRDQVREMASFLTGLERRGLASKIDQLQMYEAFIGARFLSDARALAEHHPMPELEVLPELREASDLAPGPTAWAVNPKARELVHRNVDVHQPAQVVVVSHPLCHFSRAAMRDIQADPVLGEVLAAHATWLAPPDNRIDFDVLQKWNRQNPAQEISIASRRDDWPMIDSWATPTFYVLKGGRVAMKVEGWPRAGQRSELLAALRQVGLL